MSIVTSSASELRKKGAHYTVLANHVLKSIRCSDALAIWAYLQSQSSGFVVRPAYIQEHLNIGEQRYQKAMQYLRELRLVTTAHSRDQNGRIIGNYLDCYGEPIEFTETPENPDSGKTRNPEKPDSGETGCLIKDQSSIRLQQNQSGVKDTYSPEFEHAWSRYPKRPGMSKVDAWKAWKARLKAGHDAEKMIHGAIRYAGYVKAAQIEPQYIKQPATFFGPGLHFESDWHYQPPEGKFDPFEYMNRNRIGDDNGRHTDQPGIFDGEFEPVA